MVDFDVDQDPFWVITAARLIYLASSKSSSLSGGYMVVVLETKTVYV